MIGGKMMNPTHDSTNGRRMTAARRGGFTLVELLSVVGILGSLASMLMPSLLAATTLTRKRVCQANIRILQLGNHAYAAANNDCYAPGAPHISPCTGQGNDPLVNLVRWFGTRPDLNTPFSRDDGPLSPYLPSQVVAGCTSFTGYADGFEAGCGGYGYNNSFVGQYIRHTPAGYSTGMTNWHLSGNTVLSFPRPSETVAFTDTALATANGPIEYSFCEPPTWPLTPKTRVQPSVHFRHMGKANIVWLDAHVSDAPMTFTLDKKAKSPYGVRPEVYSVGWFGPKDNTLFQCR
jgi:prepilin-type N-terminal cleavage/methylation domain-containing protein/prepilin-type processing-associated H-X9-DG protein